MRAFFALALASMAFVLPSMAQDTPEPITLETDKDKVSYALGTQIGQTLKQAEAEVSLDLLRRGVEDVLANREPALAPEEIQRVMFAFQQAAMLKRQQRMAQQAGVNKTEGAAFLAENAKKDGVVVLPSGLQYKVITEGTGETPGETDKVKAHYRGTFIDGTIFDGSNSDGEPAEFEVNGVIAGWTEALQLMKEGAKWQLFIPSDIAYGDRGRARIPPGATLLFDIELIEVISE
jgi:FKBP-type peptidyl-prolyl cis-trans isomerase FklB